MEWPYFFPSPHSVNPKLPLQYDEYFEMDVQMLATFEVEQDMQQTSRLIFLAYGEKFHDYK